jgi:hypothetical protein
MTSPHTTSDLSRSDFPSCLSKLHAMQDMCTRAFLACQIVTAFLADPKDLPHNKYTEFHGFVVGFIVALQYTMSDLVMEDCSCYTWVPFNTLLRTEHATEKISVLIRTVLDLCPGHHTNYVPDALIPGVSRSIFAHSTSLRRHLNSIHDGVCSRATIEGYIAGSRLAFKGLRYDVAPLPAICRYPDLLTNSAPIDFYGDGSTFLYPGNELYIGRESTDSPTIYLPDGRNITCHVVSSIEECGTDSEMNPRRINVYRVVFELSKTIIAAMTVFVNFGRFSCHRVMFWRSNSKHRFAGGAMFAHDRMCDRRGDANIPLGTNFGACQKLLEDIALQLHTDPGSRLNADEGKLSMLNSAGEEIWAITASVTTTCYCPNATLRHRSVSFDTSGRRSYICGVCYTCDLDGQCTTNQPVPLVDTPCRSSAPLALCGEDACTTMDTEREKEWRELRWSPLRAAWVGSVIRTAGARSRARARVVVV